MATAASSFCSSSRMMMLNNLSHSPPLAASCWPRLPLSVRTRRNASNCIRATAPSEEGTAAPDISKQLQDVFEDVKAKYGSLENKSSVWIYGGGALAALWLSSTILGAINSVPLVPKLLELIGIGYAGWFVYRYLLFKSSRKQLAADLEELKLKITGVPRSAFRTEDDE